MAVENTGFCSTEGCSGKLVARGLCGNCYKKAERRGALPELKRWVNPVSNQHPLYKIWSGMKTRCDNQEREDYKSYGGRGIYYNPSWGQFPAFYKDMADGYSPGLVLDRINNDAPYTKINCRWASPATSAQNRRTTKLNKRSVLLIRALFKAKRPEVLIKHFNEVIAPLFNIAPSTVSNITSNRQWQL